MNVFDGRQADRLLSRRGVLASCAAFLLAGGLRPAVAGGSERPAAASAARAWALDDFTKNVQAGGPPKDGIPPIDRPTYVTAGEADKFLDSDDVVFGFEYAGLAKAYPQKILVWHEIVNDEFAGEKISITYCPLTGSAVGFRGRSTLDGAPLTFGTTGRLVNSNLLMYDRQTDSEWPQILGAAIAGPQKGARLEELSVAWTTWALWRKEHPDAGVLSLETGFFRAYGTDPYGSYRRRGTYYDSGEPFFPVMAIDRRFPAKHVVVGAKVGRVPLAISKDAVATRKTIEGSVNGVRWVARWHDELEVVRVFERPAGAGAQERPLPAYDVMWFAWYAFFPNTEVWGAPKG